MTELLAAWQSPGASGRVMMGEKRTRKQRNILLARSKTTGKGTGRGLSVMKRSALDGHLSLEQRLARMGPLPRASQPVDWLPLSVALVLFGGTICTAWMVFVQAF